MADPPGKSNLTWLQKTCSRHRICTWKEINGGITWKSTSHALTKVLAVRQRLRKNKQNSATFLGDAIKAFDRTSWEKLLGQVKKKLKHADLVRRVITRHPNVKVKSCVGNETVTMCMRTGVPQGCPKRPPLYVTGYEKKSRTKLTRLEREQDMRGL